MNHAGVVHSATPLALRDSLAQIRQPNIGTVALVACAGHRAFSRDMDFPFLGIRTSPDLVRYRDPTWPEDRPAQEIDVHWSGLKLQHWNGRHFRGQRPYFGCPHCRRRAIKLYDAGGFITCRTCCNLRFQTQQQRLRARLKLKAQKIRARLDDSGKPGDLWPKKPYGMSRKVYHRHLQHLLKVEMAIHSGERIASPLYRRERERNRDGSFVTQ
jgi:hypothetical protein